MPVPSSSWITQFVSKILLNYGAVSLLGCQLVTRPRILVVVIIYRHVFLNICIGRSIRVDEFTADRSSQPPIQTLLACRCEPPLPSFSKSQQRWLEDAFACLGQCSPSKVHSKHGVCCCFCNCKLQQSKGSLTLGV